VDPAARQPEEVSAELFDFLSAFLRDLERGEPRALSEYLRRFPGCEAELRSEYAQRIDGEAAPPSPEVRRVGPYRLLRELGRGGQGVVYLAEDTRIARRVALKLLPASSLLFSQDKRGRLQREAEIVSRLDHPGICGIYDAEVSGDFAYIAMPVIAGVTLGAAIAQARSEGTRPGAHSLPLVPSSRADLQRLLGFFEECARALHAAHEAGVVHRDVKPGNLMVTPEGRGVWLDFGQALDTEAATRALTQPGEVFGTPAYMSPEQVAGDVRRVDARTDVWALGVSLFEALTLERPFRGASAHALLSAVQESPPPSVRASRRELPRDVDVVLRTALEKDPSRRYASALEFADELGRIRRSEPILARPAGPLLRLRRWARRSPVLFATTSGALLALSLALLWTLYLLAREQRALDYALGRHLGERAVALLEEDPSASLVLGIEAVERAPSYLTRSALYAALERCYVSRELDGYAGRRFRDIALLDDGNHVAAAFDDGSVRLFALETGLEVQRWPAHGGAALCVAAAGDWVASVGEDCRALIFDTTRREEVARIERLESGVDRLQLHREAWGSDHLTVGHGTRGVIYSLPDGRELGLAFLEPTELQLEALGLPLRTDREGVVIHASPSPDGRRWAVAMESGVVDVFWAPSRRLEASLEGYLKPVKVLWTPDGQFLVTHSKGPTARVWYARHRPDVYRLVSSPEPVERVAFGADGERALVVKSEGDACLWTTPSRPKACSEIGEVLSWFQVDEADEWPREFWPLALELGVWPGRVGELVGAIPVTRRLRLSPDGERLAVITRDGRLRLVSMVSADLEWEVRLRSRDGAEVAAVDLAFHPAGTELAAACEDGRVRFLDASTGGPTREDLRTIPPRRVEWSADGERLLVIGWKGRAAFHVQHLETGARMRTEVFHHGDITSGAFSPDGALVLTSSMDGTIFVRDVRDGSPVVHLRGDGAPVLHAAFSPGPGPLRVIGGFADGSARVWPVDPLPAAKARKPRELSEWELAREQRLALPLEYR
jgi:serine/threonine protein kinase/WD40 repeat protein